MNEILIEKIPQELKDVPQWVCWKSEPRKDGKIDKIPMNPVNNAKASSADPGTWASFEKALYQFNRRKGRGIDGIGFVFNENDPYVGIDLDNCINPETGKMDLQAEAYIDKLHSYTEKTPSGEGIHIIVGGKIPRSGRKEPKLGVEIYQHVHFFTVTGSHLEGTPTTIEDRQKEVEVFYRDIFGKEEERPTPTETKPTLLSDKEILERGASAKNGAKFNKLMQGDHSDYSSQSEGDLALCNQLAFWCGNNPEQIDRLFRQSKLYRPKWNEKHGARTYSEMTISLAIQNTTETFTLEGRSCEEAEEADNEVAKIISIEGAILPATDFIALDLPAKETLLDPWLTEQSITLISGWRGTGKTWLALSILNAISKGEPFGPWKAETSVPCLFLDGEMPVQDIIERVKDLNIDSVYVYSDAYANTLGIPGADLLNKTWRDAMKQLLIRKDIKLWVIDNIGALAKGIDENIKKDWDPINAWLLELRFAGIATILLHHTGKGGGQRGTSAREDNIDNSIILQRPFDYTPEDGCKFVMHFDKARVRTQDLKLIPDTQFQLRQDEAGKLIWVSGGVKEENKKQVLRSLDEGISQADICNLTGLSKGYVSKIKFKLFQQDYLGKNNKITPTGLSYLYEEKQETL